MDGLFPFGGLPPRQAGSDELIRGLSRAMQPLAFLPLAEARLGLRHAALVAVGWTRYKRGMILAEAASRLPAERAVEIVPTGRRLLFAEDLERLAYAAEEAVRREGSARVCPSPQVCPHQRPWRTLAVAVHSLPYTEAQREELLALVFRLPEPPAWLLRAYLRLGLRKGLEAGELALGLYCLLEGWRRFFHPHRERWLPWLYGPEAAERRRG